MEQATPFRCEVGDLLGTETHQEQPVRQAIREPMIPVGVGAILGDLRCHLPLFAALHLLFHGTDVRLAPRTDQARNARGGHHHTLAIGHPLHVGKRERQFDDLLRFTAVNPDHVQRGSFVLAAFAGEGDAHAIGAPYRCAIIGLCRGQFAWFATRRGHQPDVGRALVLRDVPLLHHEGRRASVRRKLQVAQALHGPQVLRGDEALTGCLGEQ